MLLYLIELLINYIPLHFNLQSEKIKSFNSIFTGVINLELFLGVTSEQLKLRDYNFIFYSGRLQGRAGNQRQPYTNGTY